MELIITLLSGLFVLLGTLIVFIIKDNHRIVDFSISIAFGVMIMLIGMELVPEAYELISNHFQFPYHLLLMIGSILLGILILKILDLFIPDHEIESHSKKSETDNFLHIGIVSSVALILHNIIEGMAIYSTVSASEIGFLIMIGVGLHNIPLGMIITSTLYDFNKSKKKTFAILFLISLSTLLGGIIMVFLSPFISEVMLGILLCLTLGMLIYIAIFELLSEMLHSKKKSSIVGIILGIAIFLISSLFE